MEEVKCENCANWEVGENTTPCSVCSLNFFDNDPRHRIYASHWMSAHGCSAVQHPAHYQGKHECIDEMIALFGVEAVKAFCKCNVYKYRYRADRKNGAEDIDKANWYMDKLMELEGANNDQD